MKTITQYKEDIANLMKSAGDIDAKCVNENRDPSDSEVALKNEIMDTVEEYKRILGSMERQERIAKELSEPQKAVTRENTIKDPQKEVREKDRFNSLGEQLAAVVVAGKPGGKIDPRLYNQTGLNETAPSEGGFLVQTDFTNELLQDVFTTGVLAQRCRRMQISSNSNSMKINGVDETSRASTRYGGIVGYWKAEGAAKVASQPKFRQIELNLKKLIGLCYSTDELLEDAAALESFIRGAFAGEFGFLIDDAIINGTGAGQPLGILNSGCLVTQDAEAGQDPDTVVTENIVKMYSRRFASQTGNYAWYYNQNIEPQLHTMSLAVGAGGGPVYMPPGGLSDAPYGRLMGLPAIAIEQAATLGDVGDIILANFKDGYILAEKGGIKADVSIHVAFLQDESIFRFVLRLDGQPLRASALTPYKGGASTQSHFIVLEAR
jgi:HK97 family phage major capsid protein